MSIPTPHINANNGDFAKTVLMPGDPLRSKFIAENFLDGAVLINNVRGIQGYTGTYKGNRVSVMASGMGMPSMGIYSYELLNFFDVENIIRIGSIGGISENVNLRDIVVALGACTNSSYGSQFGLNGTFSPIASYSLLKNCACAADKLKTEIHVGNVYSSDTFYDDTGDLSLWKKMGVLGVEMESAALYMNAARAGKNALCICTVSDLPLRNESLSAEDREKTFTQMMTLALETAIVS